ncbi:TetR family transcriptional regulator [Hahella sp. CCB-MM4]|uniref:TetR/AcrR family transcriptional regulator n=1 Tax=Hahella sp. (strain CCB-MM4) TaxID=1926491 RepID=UPI000B9B3A5C|nr:TetR/AcrR family transcriptional regulator [Hahella sp. CCB-MM4]OZG74290.1 TetR family transcriptional regulator [Hahella sp. CCB-MM4]
MGRSISFDPQEKLYLAMKLFWENGYEATSMQQLVETLGINRFSLYNCYGDKEALFHLALDHYSNTVIRRLIDPLLQENADITGLIGYLQLLQGAMAGKGGRWGCFVQNAGIERGLHDERTQKRVDEWYQQLEALIRNALQRTGEAGQLRGGIQPDHAARYIVTVLQGIIAMRRSSSDPQRYDSTLDFLISEIQDWMVRW